MSDTSDETDIHAKHRAAIAEATRNMSNKAKDEIAREVDNLLQLLSQNSKSAKAAIEKTRAKVFKHSDETVIQYLHDHERLRRDVYIKQDDDSPRPDKVFIVARLDKVALTGTMFNFVDDGDRLVIRGEDFTGVALEVVMGDLEADGFE